MSYIVERLKEPVSMSMFASKDDMLHHLVKERGEAATEITRLQAELSSLKACEGTDTDTRPRYSMKRMRDEIAKAKAYARAEALEEALSKLDSLSAEDLPDEFVGKSASVADVIDLAMSAIRVMKVKS